MVKERRDVIIFDVERYLNNFYKGTKNPSLDGIKYLVNKYNNFHNKMKFIHIAGTNGKGSCTEIISNILIKQGYKVGKFLSPHLIKYNERISINGKDISNEEMANIIEELNPVIEEYNQKQQINITLFELETIMALLYFYRNNVDFVVLETGLGGLYDSTNVISNPLVSLITSIGYDHMRILGDTLPEIAKQKAGIIKENSSTVIFEQTSEVNNIFINECNNKNNTLHIINEKDISNYSFDNNFQYFNFKDMKNLRINLKGIVQIRNASICIEAIKILKELGYVISQESILQGLSTVIHRGRMETLNDKPLIIFDGAHNEPAIINLQDMVKKYYNNHKRTYIISILKRKDYKKMLELLSEDKDALFILTSGNAPDKYATGEELYEVAIKYKSKDKILIKNLDDAIEYVMSNNIDSVNFVVGSFYVYGTVIDKIRNFNK